MSKKIHFITLNGKSFESIGLLIIQYLFAAKQRYIPEYIQLSIDLVLFPYIFQRSDQSTQLDFRISKYLIKIGTINLLVSH